MGPSAKIPHLVVASNKLDLGPSLGGNVALTAEGEVDFTQARGIEYDGDNCTGTALVNSTNNRTSVRWIGPDGTLLKANGASIMITSRSTRNANGCFAANGTIQGVPFVDTRVAVQRYNAAELAIELR